MEGLPPMAWPSKEYSGCASMAAHLPWSTQAESRGFHIKCRLRWSKTALFKGEAKSVREPYAGRHTHTQREREGEREREREQNNKEKTSMIMT